MENENNTKPSKHGKKRTVAQRAADLAFIERHVLRGQTQMQIVELLAAERPYRISRQQVAYDVNELKRRWSKASMEAFAFARARALRVLDELGKVGWELMDSPALSAGDGIRRVLDVHDRRMKLLGLEDTWGRQLQHHPHVHFVVPAGGLRGHQWIGARQADWLLPVAKLAAVFRRRLEGALRASAPALHAAVPAGTWRGRWIVHSQPAGSGANVVRYLARYVGRTAISDEPVVSVAAEAVTFRYTDSATQQKKLCTLGAGEFLRRYLQHVLPSGQHRVRYFGWQHPAAKARRLLVETLLAKPIILAPPPPLLQWPLRCPHCAAFALVRIGTLPRQARAPPLGAAA